jgi:DNA-binding winged helix-turn-helix (wHTH) protein
VVEVEALLALSGRYPTLLKAVADWWLLTLPHPPLDEWAETVLAAHNTQHALQELWQNFTQEEQEVLATLQPEGSVRATFPAVRRQRFAAVCRTLVAKGICRVQNAVGSEPASEPTWVVAGALLSLYSRRRRHTSRGGLWFEPKRQQFYQGQTPLTDLTPKEAAILTFLLQQPNRRHTYTELILHAWDSAERYHGVTNDSLFQVVHSLRQKLEADPGRPCYLVNWRGKPEGGYILYPEGRPEEVGRWEDKEMGRQKTEERKAETESRR